ncbi:hypothetical protein [Kitasatospora sp. NPDC093679]|uniref:hypothetical protein n=1 Tax=Kitasatospora sp. NPDC093679 TaxID=3154983 RepID=UPI00343AC5EE
MKSTTTAGPLRPAPVGTADPAAMTDEQIGAEIDALTAHQQDVQAHPGAWDQLRTEIVPRRTALAAERRRRKLARRDRERAQREAAALAGRRARTAVGARRPDGRYPVSVDGLERGVVWRSGRSWWREVDGQAQPDGHGTRREAADAVVQTADVRAEREREEERRAQPPAGWVAGGDWRALERLDVLRLPGGRSGAAWGPVWRVTGREEHRGGRVSFRMEPVGSDDLGVVLFGEDLARFVRPAAETLAGLPGTPFRLLFPAEHTARRLLDVSDELACLRRRPGCAAAERALVLLAGVEDGSSREPAADMRRIADLAGELGRIVAVPETRDWRHWAHDRRLAEHAQAFAARAAERFEAGGGALTEEYRAQLRG